MKKYNPLAGLEAAFDRLLAPRPLEEIVTEVLEIAADEIMQCDYTIKRQEFIRHMAQARQKAMIDWVAKERL